MNDYPDFSDRGYRVQKILGANEPSGRVTYLATEIEAQKPVVIKQFQFGRVRDDWSNYDSFESETEALKSLESPVIPRYLDSFETQTGFCLVQEYKNAPSLGENRYWTPAQVKQIAIAMLDILIDLQNQKPAVIHRDIKPENILVETREELIKVYLIDFGFVHRGEGNVAASSVVKGTMGFMPPEQMYNRQLTQASDLYSLGVTLFCLLASIRSSQINEIMSDRYQLDFTRLPPNLNPKFVAWLKKMTEPQMERRFPNATVARKALEAIDTDVKIRLWTDLIYFFSDRKPTFWGVSALLIAIASGLTAGSILLNQFIATREWEVKGSMKQFTGSIRTIARKSVESPKFPKEALLEIEPLEENLKRLMETGECPGCTFQDITISGNLVNANLAGAYFKNVRFGGALKGANLKNANLEKIQVFSGTFENANFKNAKIKGLFLYKSGMDSANFENADIEGLVGSGSSGIKDANFKNATLQNSS
ncbi:MAG: serine/threonine-protein kinase, partial [Cyanobacteria bacterium P01_E01_bin.42]